MTSSDESKDVSKMCN